MVVVVVVMVVVMVVVVVVVVLHLMHCSSFIHFYCPQVQDGGATAYRSIFHAFRAIVSKDGIMGLYQGFTPNIIGSGVAWGVYFYTYNFGKRLFFQYHQHHQHQHQHQQQQQQPTHNHESQTSKSRRLSAPEYIVSGAFAGFCTSLVTNPIWMMKTRLQLQDNRSPHRKYRGFLHALYRTIHDEGFFALYRGFSTSLMMISNNALQFMAYEELKLVAINLAQGEENLTTSHFLLMGAMAKTFSSTTTYPLQVIRSRLYTAGTSMAATPEAAQVKGIRQVISYVFRTKGLRGFYSGLTPNLLKTAPASALTFMTYEQMMRFLN